MIVKSVSGYRNREWILLKMSQTSRTLNRDEKTSKLEQLLKWCSGDKGVEGRKDRGFTEFFLSVFIGSMMNYYQRIEIYGSTVSRFMQKLNKEGRVDEVVRLSNFLLLSEFFDALPDIVSDCKKSGKEEIEFDITIQTKVPSSQDHIDMIKQSMVEFFRINDIWKKMFTYEVGVYKEQRSPLSSYGLLGETQLIIKSYKDLFIPIKFDIHYVKKDYFTCRDKGKIKPPDSILNGFRFSIYKHVNETSTRLQSYIDDPYMMEQALDTLRQVETTGACGFSLQWIFESLGFFGVGSHTPWSHELKGPVIYASAFSQMRTKLCQRLWKNVFLDLSDVGYDAKSVEKKKATLKKAFSNVYFYVAEHSSFEYRNWYLLPEDMFDNLITLLSGISRNEDIYAEMRVIYLKFKTYMEEEFPGFFKDPEWKTVFQNWEKLFPVPVSAEDLKCQIPDLRTRRN